MGSLGPKHGEKAELTADHIAAIRQLLKKGIDQSRLLVPGDEGYNESLKRWSPTCVKRAPASFLPRTPESISLILPYLSKHNIDVAVTGGGHSTTGVNATAIGLAINLKELNHTVVDPTTKTIRVGGGATWGEVDQALAKHGLATVGGTVSDTGVGGLILGGGYGWLSGQYGLVIDNLISAKVVLANGNIVTASKKENQDLFWGLRGAGQNFGVTTGFTLQAYPQKDVYAGMLIYPSPLLPQVVRAWNEILPTMSGKAAGGIAFVRRGGQALIASTVFWDGPEEEGKKVFKPLLDLEPFVNDAKTRPYPETNTILNSEPGRCISMKGFSFSLPLRPEFAQRTFEAYIKFTQSVPDASESVLIFEMLNPTELCTVASNRDMAFANRGNHLNALAMAAWQDRAYDDACKQFPGEVAVLFEEEMKLSQATGETKASTDAVMVYGNYDHYDDKPREVFGSNYQRLSELKKKYDPGHMFNKRYPVPPAA